MNEQTIEKIYKVLDSFFSLIRVFLSSKFRKTATINKKNDKCIILGNGPSLTETLARNEDKIHQCDLIAVNFMGESEDFQKYRPSVYICVDPVFWFNTKDSKSKSKVSAFYKKMSEIVSWNMQMYLPFEASKINSISAILKKNKNIKLQFFNKTKVNGCLHFSHFFYNRQLGMPRPQNILVAALMLAIYSDYKEIYLAGADNDWIRNLWVDKNNNVRLDDFHFYDKDKNQPARFMPFTTYEMLTAFSLMFKSYQEIAAYVKCKKEISIFNLGERSFIDAFEKKNFIQ